MKNSDWANCYNFNAPAVLPDGNGGFTPCPELMTEAELIQYLRISLISKSENHHNVIEHLKRMRDFPRLAMCNKVLYPLEAVREWVKKETKNGK
jgi:hypothetical protein